MLQSDVLILRQLGGKCITQPLPKTSLDVMKFSQYYCFISLFWPQERTLFYNLGTFFFLVPFCFSLHKVLYQLTSETIALHKKKSQCINSVTKNECLFAQAYGWSDRSDHLILAQLFICLRVGCLLVKCMAKSIIIVKSEVIEPLIRVIYLGVHLHVKCSFNLTL